MSSFFSQIPCPVFASEFVSEAVSVSVLPRFGFPISMLLPIFLLCVHTRARLSILFYTFCLHRLNVTVFYLVQSLLPEMLQPDWVNPFIMQEYNASVEFYWAPLIVESNSDDPVNHRLDHRMIRPNSLLKHASQWEKADILVFNSYLWWRSGPKVKLL